MLFHVEQRPTGVRPEVGHSDSGDARTLAAVLEAVTPEFSSSQRSDARRRLVAYGSLVAKWAPKVNLVSNQDLPRFMERHVQAALSLRPAVRGVSHEQIVDVGSGAGLPGIPLAITLPQTTVTLVESRRRRAHFLRQAARELALTNVTVVSRRVEDWSPPKKADLILSRAVTDPASLARLAGHCLAPAGFLLVTSGPRTQDRTHGMSAFLLLQSDHVKPLQALLAYPGARSWDGS